VIFFFINADIFSYAHFNCIIICCVVNDHKTAIRQCLEDSTVLWDENGLKLRDLIEKAFKDEEGGRKIRYGFYGRLINELKTSGNQRFKTVIADFLELWISAFSSYATVEKLIKYLEELNDYATVGMFSCNPIYFACLVAVP